MENPSVIITSVIAICVLLAACTFAEPAWHANMEKAWQACSRGDYSQTEVWLNKGLAEAAKFGNNPAPWQWQAPLRPPTMSGELATLADAYSMQGKFDRAEWLFKKAISIAPKDDTYYSKGLAELYSKQERYSDAEPLYRKLAQGGNFYGVLDLAKCYSKEGKLTDADSAYTEALQLIESAAPDSGTLSFALTEAGKFYLKNGNRARAKELLQRSLSIQIGFKFDNTAAVEYGCLGEIYAAEGNYTEAERLFKRAIAAHRIIPSVCPREEAATRRNYAKLLRRLNRLPEAKQQELAANSIKTESPPRNDPTIYQ
jgi:tetratricopeptide (TPR) repeat protein